MNRNGKIAIAVIGVAVLLMALAFQGPTQKFGVVDIGVLSDASKLGKRKKVEFEAKQQKWINLLQFMRSNRFFTLDNVKRFRELSLLDKPTADQTKQLEDLKTAIQKITDEFQGLVKVAQPTEEQSRRRQDLVRMADETTQMLNELGAEYQDSMRNMAADLKEEVTSKARAAVQKYGRQQGFTVIFEISMAVYGANDVTNDAVKVMDADNP